MQQATRLGQDGREYQIDLGSQYSQKATIEGGMMLEENGLQTEAKRRATSHYRPLYESHFVLQFH